MASKTTMRRAVRAAGGYYSRGQWVLPGTMHNCGGSVDTQWLDSLEEAYEACEEHASACADVQAFGEAVGAYLRSMR